MFGGRDGVLSEHLILSAIARPYVGYYPRIWQKAAAFVESMAGNHGFVDGNKRSTLILLHTLVTKSGYALVYEGTELRDLIVSAADGSASFEELAAWFKTHIRR